MVRVLGREQRSEVSSSVGETPVGAETEASQHAVVAVVAGETLESDTATRDMEAETETDQVLGHT